MKEQAIVHDSDVHCFHDCAVSRNKLSLGGSYLAKVLGVQSCLFPHSLNPQAFGCALYVVVFCVTNIVILKSKEHLKSPKLVAITDLNPLNRQERGGKSPPES